MPAARARLGSLLPSLHMHIYHTHIYFYEQLKLLKGTQTGSQGSSLPAGYEEPCAHSLNSGQTASSSNTTETFYTTSQSHCQLLGLSFLFWEIGASSISLWDDRGVFSVVVSIKKPTTCPGPSRHLTNATQAWPGSL